VARERVEEHCIGSLTSNCSAIEGESFLDGFQSYSTIHLPWVVLPTPNSGSRAALENALPRLLRLGVTTASPRQDTSTRRGALPLQGEVGRGKECFGGAGCPFGGAGAHFTMQQMERL